MTERTHLEIQEDKIAVITLDDGKVNAMSTAMLTEIGSRLDQAAKDAEITIMTGREGIFSAGFDLNVIQGGPDVKREMVASGVRLIEKMLTHPHPIITACTGHAYPMGAFLMLSADVRYGVSGDWKIGMNEVAIRLTVPHFALALARHRLSSKAFALISTATMFNPEEACAAGYLDEVTAVEEVHSRSLDCARKLVSQLDRESYIGTKERINAPVLAAIRDGARKDGLID